VLLAKPHCRNSLQRSQAGALATPAFGSRGRAPGALRLLLSLYCSNSRRVVQWFLSEEPSLRLNDNQTAFASVRLCECEPRMTSHVKSMGTYWSFKILAKIAASFTRALAQFFTQRCFRAEARRGYFPPTSLKHQTGPP
jgi:hypothetical protein